jgi:hypothetical protein
MNAIWEWPARLIFLVSLLMPAGMAWAQGGQGACKPGIGCTSAFVGNPGGSQNSAGVAMFASFTPGEGLSLSEAAALLGYTGFDWVQIITNWPDPNLYSASGALLTPVPPRKPFHDPPFGGYNYNPCGGAAPGAANTAFPFYYNPVRSTDCWSVAENETTVGDNEDHGDQPVVGLQDGEEPNTLHFADEPMDPELTPADIAAGDIPEFTTELVGYTLVHGKYVPGPALFEWTWETTYNGQVGGTARSANIVSGVGGTGQITILTFDGVPVPEPPALILLASGVLAILIVRKAADWNRNRCRLV